MRSPTSSPARSAATGISPATCAPPHRRARRLDAAPRQYGAAPRCSARPSEGGQRSCRAADKGIADALRSRDRGCATPGALLDDPAGLPQADAARAKARFLLGVANSLHHPNRHIDEADLRTGAPHTAPAVRARPAPSGVRRPRLHRSWGYACRAGSDRAAALPAALGSGRLQAWYPASARYAVRGSDEDRCALYSSQRTSSGGIASGPRLARFRVLDRARPSCAIWVAEPGEWRLCSHRSPRSARCIEQSRGGAAPR